jgi:hypothetical protein
MSDVRYASIRVRIERERHLRGADSRKPHLSG